MALTLRERAVDPLTGPRRKLLLFWLFFVLFAVTSNLDGANFNDVRATSAAAWNLGTNGTVDFAEVGFESVPWGREQADGSLYTDRFPGAWLPAVPVYALVSLFSEPVDDPAEFPLWPASLTAAALVAAALVVLHEVLRDEFSKGRALGVTLTVGLATPVWTIAADALWTHSSGVLVLALVMRGLQTERYVVAGAWLGYAITVRPTHALTALGIGVALAAAHRHPARLLQIGVPSALGLGAMSLYSRALFNTWLPVAGYSTERVGAVLGTSEALLAEYSWPEQLLGTFFDPAVGVFVYSAFLVVCVLFLLPGWRGSSLWARCAAVAGLLYWIGQLRGNRYTGGSGFFGYRFPIEPLWLASVVLATAWFEGMGRRWARLLGAVLLVGAYLLNLQYALLG